MMLRHPGSQCRSFPKLPLDLTSPSIRDAKGAFLSGPGEKTGAWWEALWNESWLNIWSAALFIFIHPIWLLIFFGSGGHLEPFISCRGIWQVVSRCWEWLGQIDQSRYLQRVDHWICRSLVHWQDICHICARTQHQVLATTGQMYQSEVKTQPDYMNFLHDERCWGVDCGNKAAVAFHSLLGSVCCTARRHFRHCALNVFDTSLLSAYKSKNRTHNPPWNFPQRMG